MSKDRNKIESLDREIALDPQNVSLYEQRAMIHYKCANHRAAYNDFIEIISLDPSNEKAATYIELLKMVMGYEYKENINV